MNWLNSHHLYYFWVVAREGSITAGSRKLLLAPSTVSAQIKNLEASLGVELFAREGRRLVLTQRGRLARSYGDDFVNWLNETGMGNDPRLARVLADVAEAKLEDSPRTGGAPGSGPMAPDQATSEIRRLQGDEAFQKVYYDQHHPNHEDAVRKMSRLFQQAHPEPRRG